MPSPTEFNLEQRVAEFASRAISVCEALPNRTGAAHIKDQKPQLTIININPNPNHENK